MNLIDGRMQEFGKLIEPLFDHLPPIAMHEWHRFSFDIVQLSSGVQVAHIRFKTILPDSAEGSRDGYQSTTV